MRGRSFERPLKTTRLFSYGLAKVALQQAGEGLAMTGLVASHLVHGVVDGVQAGGLGALGQVELAGGGAVLGLNAHLEVLLGGVGHDLAQELSELGGVLGLLVRCLLPVQADLRIALAVGDAGHGQVHAHLGALALEVSAKVVHDVLGDLGELANAHDVLGGPGHLGLGLLDETVARDAALRALEISGQLLAVELLNVTANGANKLHGVLLLLQAMHADPSFPSVGRCAVHLDYDKMLLGLLHIEIDSQKYA